MGSISAMNDSDHIDSRGPLARTYDQILALILVAVFVTTAAIKEWLAND